MDYDIELMHLSAKFISDYPTAQFPELLLKSGRSYSCLLYLNTYIDHVKGINELHTKEHQRKYLYSTLPYFHRELGISTEK